MQPYGAVLEDACVTACKQMRAEAHWDSSVAQQGFEELWKLNDGQDADYDCASIGLHYALWYHLQRTHYMARALTPILCEQSKRLAIYDLGCGTGATAWAAAIAISALRKTSDSFPKVAIFGLDMSKHMLEAGDRLWSALIDRLPTDINYNPLPGSWTQSELEFGEFEYVLISCSYLFNDSDLSDKNIGKSREQLLRICESTHATNLLTVSSPRKARSIEEISGFEVDDGYCPLDSIWTNRLSELSAERHDYLDEIGKRSPKKPAWSEQYDPIFGLYAMVLNT